MEYTAAHTEAVKNMLALETRYFGLLTQSSNDPDVLALGIPYTHTVGLHREGFPEIIVYGGFPDAYVGELVKYLMVSWSNQDKETNDFITDIPLSAGGSQMAVARTVEVTAQNKARYGKIFEHVWPGLDYRIVQILIPDENGYLPGMLAYDDLILPQPNLSMPDAEKVAPQVAVEEFRDSAIGAAVTDELEPLRLHIEEHKVAVYHEKTDLGPVVFTVGMCKKDLPELMISGTYSKQFVGEMLQTLVQDWIANPPDVRSMSLPVEVESIEGIKIKAEARLVRVTEENRAVTTDRVVLGLWPDQVYEVFQLILPNSNGILPGEEGYVDLDNTQQRIYADTTDMASLIADAMKTTD